MNRHQRYQKWCIAMALAVSVVALAVGSVAAQTRVTFATWGTESEWQPYIDMFEAANPDVEVELIALTWGEYWEKIYVMIASGVEVDVVRLGRQHLPSFVQLGLLADMGPLMQQHGFDEGQYIPAFLQGGVLGGVQYGMPEHTSTTNAFYNANLYESLGLENPHQLRERGAWNWSTFLDSARKLTRDLNQDGIAEQWGAYMYSADQGQWQSFVRSNGGQVYSDDHTHMLLDQPQAIEALRFFTDLTAVHKVVHGPTGYGEWLQGNVGLTVGAPSFVQGWSSADFDIGIVPLPPADEGQETSAIVPNLMAISSLSSNPGAAWRFIDYIMGEEVQMARIPTYSILSAHRDVALETARLLPVQNAHLLLEIAENSFPMEATVEFIRIDSIIGPALSAAAEGQIPIDEAVRERIVPSVNAILAEVSGQ